MGTTFPFKIFGEPFLTVPLLSKNKGDTIIGNYVWLGYDVTIMPCVIIASKTTITRDIDPYNIVGGNPVSLIRKRFSMDVIELLLSLSWWGWNLAEIADHANLLLSGNVVKLNKISRNEISK